VVFIGVVMLIAVYFFKVSSAACILVFFWGIFGFFEGHFRTMDFMKDTVNLKRQE
jgi:uncharacterized membrane protein HdeD (DUF308 family)